MHPGDVHLPGYPSGTEYWHYVSAYGYASYGANTHYVDSYWRGLGKHTNYPSANVVSLVDELGIVW